MTNQTAVLDEIMEELESPPAPRAILSADFEARSAELPKWFRDQQEAAWKKFEALPYPNRKDQPWRFSNVNALDFSLYHLGALLSQSERAEILEDSSGLNNVSGGKILVDDDLLRLDSLSQKVLAGGVMLYPFAG